MSKKKINIAVIGATGYTGLDLILLLSKHPKISIKYLCATKNLGKNINFFDKRIKKKLPKITSVDKIDWSQIKVAFLSLPNGEAQKLIKKVYYKFFNIIFIDLSADFRLKDSKIYKLNYKIKHKAKNLIKKSVYSIPEITNNLKDFRIIANPGCYSTSIQIPLIPLLKKKLIKLKNIIIDSKSGFSGAGKNLKNKFKHKNLLPTFRGILTSIYLNLNKNCSINKIQKELIKFYKNKKFIKILKINSQLGSGNVLNTNYWEISVCNTRIKNRLVIFSALDNLIKGASGQAIQNMNISMSLRENLGLKWKI